MKIRGNPTKFSLLRKKQKGEIFPIYQVSFYLYGETGTGTPNGGMLGRMLKIMTNSRTNSPQIRFR